MTGFLSKMRSNIGNNILGSTASNNLSFNDEFDSRVIYFIRNRAKRITIKIDTAHREAHVTVPGKRNINAAKSFVAQKRDWIAVQLERLPQPQPFEHGRTFLFRGEPFTLINPTLNPNQDTPNSVSTRKRPRVDFDARHIIVPASPDTLAGRTKRYLIKLARHDLTIATAHYASVLEQGVESISIRDTTSRWGSCLKGSGGRGGKINYSWRLILAPDYVLDYVVAHECAHLIEANHGPDFWALVEDLIDYDMAPARKWLSKYGSQLHAVGAN